MIALQYRGKMITAFILSQVNQTDPEHIAGQLCYTVPVPPDSFSTLSAGASRQLRYTVSWLVVTLLLPILLASARLCRGAGVVSKGSRLEAWMNSHKSEVAIT